MVMFWVSTGCFALGVVVSDGAFLELTVQYLVC